MTADIFLWSRGTVHECPLCKDLAFVFTPVQRLCRGCYGKGDHSLPPLQACSLRGEEWSSVGYPVTRGPTVRISRVTESRDYRSGTVGFPVESPLFAKWKGLCETLMLVAQLSWKLVPHRRFCVNLNSKSQSPGFKKMSKYSCRCSVHFNENCPKYLHPSSSFLILPHSSVFFW